MNLPNKITLFRTILIPVFIVFLLVDMGGSISILGGRDISLNIFIAALIFIVSIFIMSILSLKYDSKNYFRFNGFFKKIFIRNTILLLCGSLFGFLGTYITTLLINNNFSSVLFIKNLLSVSFVSYILSLLASFIVTFLLFLSTLFIMYRKKKIKY